MPMNDQELADAKRLFQSLANICQMAGRVDGHKACHAIAEGISEEQAHRSRGGQPRG